jgi:hypothetical protein
MHSYSGVRVLFRRTCCLLLRLAHSRIFAAFDARKAALTSRLSVPLACGSVLRSQRGAQRGKHLRTRTGAEPTTDPGDPFTTRACPAAVRSAEAMVAEFAVRGYDVSNVQPR